MHVVQTGYVKYLVVKKDHYKNLTGFGLYNINFKSGLTTNERILEGKSIFFTAWLKSKLQLQC